MTVHQGIMYIYFTLKINLQHHLQAILPDSHTLVSYVGHIISKTTKP